MSVSLMELEPSEFPKLQPQQIDVLEHLADGRTSKEIARLLVISKSAVDQRIDRLRTQFGGVTRSELARIWRQARDQQDLRPSDRITWDTAHLPFTADEPDSGPRDGVPGRFLFNDSAGFSLEPAGSGRPEHRIVPGWLDGSHAGLIRLGIIVGLLLAIIATLVLGLAAAQALTDMLGEDRPKTEMSQ